MDPKPPTASGTPGTTPPTPASRPRPVSFCGFEKSNGPTGGLLVRSADKSSSAAKAGIVVGDEILALDGTRITEALAAMMLLQTAGVGATVRVSLMRAGQPMELPMAVQAKALVLELDDLDEVVERKIAPAA